MALIERMMVEVNGGLVVRDVDKVGIAVARLQEFEPTEGYYLAFSGGKDSQVIHKLAVIADVKFDAHYHVCPDPPELQSFMKSHYPDVVWEKPLTPFFTQIINKRYPPTRMVRYCCETHKEHGGAGRLVVTGIRWAESSKRSKRRMVEQCFKDKTKTYVNPILDWSDGDVWEFIDKYIGFYCGLYDEGFKRLGCVGCPMSSNQRREFARWPRFERAYKRAVRLAWEKRIHDGLDTWGWDSWEDMWNWWINNAPKKDPDQSVMFE